MKILIIANNSFSRTSSNGRTLGNYFTGWNKNEIAQFCISTTEPDYDLCNNYYCITDKEAFKSFLRFSKARRQPIEKCIGTEANTTIVSKNRSFKTATKALIRHFVWKKRWNSKEFWKWIDDFNPRIVLVMNSDSAFILEIARNVAERNNLPLVMYNTEGFYFFNHDYMKENSWFDKLSFRIYQSLYLREVRKLMRRTSLTMHLNGKLKKDFEKEFGGRHEVLYSSSSMKMKSFEFNHTSPIFNYLGNFGFDRASALIEIADVLNQINPKYKLHIYGKIPNDAITAQFRSCPNIIIEGFVNYKQVQQIMCKSTILFHAESQSPQYEENLRYGFTTKIADTLSCGVPFVMYSQPSVAGADYLIETKAGWYANDKEQLRKCIIEILSDESKRTEILQNAYSIADQNHNEDKNRILFKALIKEAVDNYA